MNWWRSLERHAFPVIGDVKVDRIQRSDVLAVLEPIWALRPETARRVQHRMPLSDPTLAVLEQASQLRDDSGLVFPSPVRPGHPISDMTLTKVLRATGFPERATVHGFRPTFRDWAAECTNAPHAVMELSVPHAVGSSVEQAYA